MKYLKTENHGLEKITTYIRFKYNCSEHYCFLKHQFIDNCIIYLPNLRPNCYISCALDNCDFVIFMKIITQSLKQICIHARNGTSGVI